MTAQSQILNSLKSKQPLPGAIMLAGEWGNGKSYFWTNALRPALKSHPVVYLSLFGATSIRQVKSDLVSRVLLSTKAGEKFDDKLGSFSKMVGGIGKGIAEVVGKIAESQTGFNPVELFSKIIPEVDPLELFPHNMIVCLDDLERCPDELVLDILGLISFLIEERKAKVLTLANENKFNEKLKGQEYAEKVFWKTISFETPLHEVFGTSLKLYSSDKSKSYIRALKPIILETFKKSDCSNIRTLNKAIKWISDLRDAKIDIDELYIRYMLMLIIHKSDTGRLLEDSNIYSFGHGYRIADSISKKKSTEKTVELDEEDKESLSFYERFQQGITIPSSVGLHKMIQTNIIDREFIINEIDPPDRKTSSFQTSKKLRSEEWFYENETKTKKLRNESLKILKNEKHLGVRTAFSIFNCIVKIDGILNQGSQDAEAAMEKYIARSDLQSDTPSDIFSDIRLDEDRKKLKPFYDKFKSIQRKKFTAQTKTTMLKAINSGKEVDFYSTTVRYSEALEDLIQDPDILKAVDKVFRKYPGVHYHFYYYAKTRAEEGNWPDTFRSSILSRLENFKRNEALDKVETSRFNLLINRYKAKQP